MSDSLVFECGCGCVSGRLYSDGIYACANCEREHDSADTIKWLPASKYEIVLAERKDHFKIVDMNSSGAAYDRALRLLTRRRGEVVGFVVIYASGTHSRWFDLEEDQVSWVHEHLDEVKEYVNAKFQDQSAIRQGGAEDKGRLSDSDQGS